VLNLKAAGRREIAASRFFRPGVLNLPVDIQAANILMWNWVSVPANLRPLNLRTSNQLTDSSTLSNRELPIA